MNSAEVLKIYDCLSFKEKAGISLLTIAKETQIPIPKFRKYLSPFSKTFVRVGTSVKYTINTFNRTRDHKEYLLSQVDKRYKEEMMVWNAAYIIIISAVIIAVSSGL